MGLTDGPGCWCRQKRRSSLVRDVLEEGEERQDKVTETRVQTSQRL
jgi:hypothetical protein